MPLHIHDWETEIAGLAHDAAVKIRYVQLSEVTGYGWYVSIIPVGEANTGHYHPAEAEKYHIVKGKGTMLSLSADQVEAGSPPTEQAVREGMTIHIPARVVHRLANEGNEPLVFFFECPLSHMDKDNPVRTVVKDFGGSFPRPS